MSRFAATNDSSASEDEQLARSAINQAWGGVPNLGAVLALSLPLTRAVLAFDAALEGGSLSARVVEQLAIAVSGRTAAHTASPRTPRRRAVSACLPPISPRHGSARPLTPKRRRRFALHNRWSVPGASSVTQNSPLCARMDGVTPKSSRSSATRWQRRYRTTSTI